jgi:G3E family GTPase
MQKQIRFVMIGGFLGAGKTTTISKIASHYVAAGKNVALVTNDQAYDLVDTQTLRAQGFTVGEVPGACFCCKFDDLVDTIGSLSDEQVPDLVIAEPVGSCTDLVATVITPMQQLFGDRFEIGPLAVLLKPEHGRKILRNDGRRGFSPKAEYIFLKQLEEADSIFVNKVDKLDPEQRDELLQLVKERFTDAECFGLSARDGEGMEDLIRCLEQEPRKRTSQLEIDYETYAEGEAELGWMNCQVTAAANEDKFELDRLVLDVVKIVGQELSNQECEVAHLKVLGQTLQSTAVANQVSSEGEAELSLASEVKTEGADLLVNARVASSPEQLEAAIQKACQQLAVELNVNLQIGGMQSFRPAKPEPTHRAE